MSEMSEEMSGATTPEAPARPVFVGRTSSSSAPFRIIALAVTLIVGGGILWLALRHNSSSKHVLNASSASPAQLGDLARKVGHPIFWIGPKSGYTYELSQSSNGNIYIRYLPAGVAVGSSDPYLTVGTYPYTGAYTALQTVANQNGETPIKLANNGLAVVSSSYPNSVHIAYPGVNYQAEVYDPTPGQAAALVAAGKLTAFGSLTPSSPPRAISPAGLRALAASLKHPVYWVGPMVGVKYEVTQTPSGQIYLRYLPARAKIGAPQEFLTVGTYPYKGAFAALQGLARQAGNRQFKLTGGGLAVLDPKYPKNIHLAFPGSDFEIELFSPSAAQARQLVSSDQVRPTG